VDTLKIKDRFTGDQTLEQELARLLAEVKANPAKASLRVYLFQLLCVLGNWERALQQLQVCAQLDAAAIPMAQTYREAIRCELLRDEVFAGRRAPHFLGSPPEWCGMLVESLRLLTQGNRDAADAMRAQAFDLAEEVSCKLDDQPVAWVADADSRLGPVCEIIVNGMYYWLPFSQIHELRLDAPEDLRDFVWLPVQLVLANGGEHVGLVPARYPGSHATDDDRIKLGRLTEWRQIGEDAYGGLGQKIWISDVGEHPILSLRGLSVSS
jgi:type VI secretion system protein ImpE